MFEKIKAYWPFLVIVILLLCLLWLAPAYREERESSRQKDKKIATLEKTIDTWENKETVTTTYRADGRPESTTSTIIRSGSSTRERSAETTTHDVDKSKLSITKRGLFHATAYWDFPSLNPLPSAYGFDYQMGFIGPSVFIQPTPFVGKVGIGVYF